jgi:CheY-like chemotaxis protein
MQKFLVVDDSRAIQSIICRAINAGGYGRDSVHAVSSGMEALEAVEKITPDLIITDWHMPGISGLELLQTLRQTGHSHIKIGFVTTEMSEARMAEARNNGVEFILHKPFKDSDLLAAIARSVGAPSASHVPGVPDSNGQEVIASVDAVTGVLNAILPATSFSLSKTDMIYPDKSSPKIVVGVYSKMEQKSVDALCFMDMACAELIGASVLGYSVAQIQAALSSEAGREAIMESLSTFLKEAATLFPSVDSKPHKLVRANFLSFENASLQKTLLHNAGMQVYELHIQNMGLGRFALLKLTA